MKSKLGILNLICCLFMTFGLLTLVEVQAFTNGDKVVLQNTLHGRNIRTNRIVHSNTLIGHIVDGTRGTFLQGPIRDNNWIWYEVRWRIEDDQKSRIKANQRWRIEDDELKAWVTQPIDGCSYIGSVEEAEKRDAIAAALFKLSEATIDDTTFHDYNGYECNPEHPRYEGGHSGLDVQTQDKSKNQLFYSLTDGRVTAAGFTDTNGNGVEDEGEADPCKTIAIYDPDKKKTTLYLHASWVHPDIKKALEEGTSVEKGHPLGKQGDSCILGAVHVHIEVQPGESRKYSLGSGDPNTETEDPIDYLYEWITEENPVENETVAREDVNGDGLVNIIDLLFVWLHRGKAAEDFPEYDVNDDGTIDNADVAEVLNNFDAAAAPQVVANNSSPFGGTPEEDALLPNYPNPFNPETWIPYQLAEASEVTITIYNVKGTIIRKLSLGHQAAGVYRSKTRAAYWDGRNELGEPVAGGVYFYTFTADGFSATRKMLVRK